MNIDFVKSPKKSKCHIAPPPPRNGHLTTATFICPQGGRCGKVRLYCKNKKALYGSEEALPLRNLFRLFITAKRSCQYVTTEDRKWGKIRE